LNIDFWKYELEKHGTYNPKKYLTKEFIPFDLPGLMKKVTSLNSNYFFYFGSQTTPPCVEQTYHLIVEKPIVISGCQFKVLRENSLLISKAKTVHARVEQPLNDRVVYVLNSSEVKYSTNTSQYPQGFNKYLMMNGFKYKSAPPPVVKAAEPLIEILIAKPPEPVEETLDKLNCDIAEKRQ